MNAKRNTSSYLYRQIVVPFMNLAGCGVCVTFLLGFAGCNSQENGVVLYTDQDRAVVEKVVKQIDADIDVPIRVEYAKPEDIQKGIGLSQRLREDRGADVYWAGNQFAIQKIVDDGLLLKIKGPLTTAYDPRARDAEFRWVGLNARIRVILYNRKSVTTSRVPASFIRLGDSQWKGKAAYADPRKSFSARYHIMTLFAIAPEPEAKSLLEKMVTNQVQLVESEQAVVDAVSSDKAAWGVTDSDLAEVALQKNGALGYAIPDQKVGSTAEALGVPPESLTTLGTPLMLTPVGLLRDRPLRGEAENLFKALVKLSTATTLETRIQPNCMATSTSLLENPPATSKSKIKDFRNLLLAQPSKSKIEAAQITVSAAVSELFKP